MSTADSGDGLQSMVYRTIRERIITGVYPQGSRLREQKLASEMGVSRVPVREVMPRLETDGFVVTERNRGAGVAAWTPSTVHDLIDVRLAVEPAAARLAARRLMAGADAAPLWQALEAEVGATAGGQQLAIAEAAAHLHQEVAVLSGNRLLATVMQSLAGRVVWLFYLTSERDPAAACAEHESLIEAIELGDEGIAAATQYAHIAKGRRPTLAALFGQEHIDRPSGTPDP
jgi:DNA-binding GntR family transcriptional regulator